MASPSSSSPPLPPSQEQNPPQFPPPSNPNSPNSTNPSIPTAKKPQPIPWTHQETVNLIQSYQEKWYSLKKGQLKSSQWEEVSVTVAARCGYDEPTKSATQCRHKIEKLRKRYRAERGKPCPDSWQYFDLMDSMESGPLPISAARPVSIVPAPVPAQRSSSSESDVIGRNLNKSKSKSINRIVKGSIFGNGERGVRVSGFPKQSIFGKIKDFYESDDDEEEEDEEVEEEEGDEMVARLAVEIRAFSDKFVKMENKKMDMVRETEKYRMEMEKKRMEMIFRSQQKLVETIHKAFSSSHKKLKMAG